MTPIEARHAALDLRPRMEGRPSHRTTLRGFALWLTVLLVLPWGGRLDAGQSQSESHDPVINGGNAPFDHTSGYPGIAVDQMQSQKRIREAREAQHKSVVSDAAKLLKLVTDLDAEIGSTKPVSLTPDQLHKVAEVEKRARNLRRLMTTRMY